MSGFLEALTLADSRDSRARAVLRRSLAFDPGTYVPSFPYVEHFVGTASTPWRRQMMYLVAGLWAAYWRDTDARTPVPLAMAAAMRFHGAESSSMERRFINLLDADTDQLPHRLRQLLSLLKDDPIDFDLLLQGVQGWNDEQKRTQIRWAREFYRTPDDAESQDTPSTDGDPQ